MIRDALAAIPGDLPAGRAERCPEEARRVDHAWLRLLLPHVAPKFQMSEEKALRFFDQQERARYGLLDWHVRISLKK